MSKKNTFPCKENGCDNEVTYSPKKSGGNFQVGPATANSEKTVYLECEDGHTHKYKVET